MAKHDEDITKSEGETLKDAKAAVINSIIDDLLARRANGEDRSDEAILAAHPDLMPELGQSLAMHNLIHRQILDAEGAGNIANDIDIISASRIDEPIALPEKEEPKPRRPLSIKGYRILNEISSGGQATVFLGVHDSTKRKVAIKVMAGGPFIGSKSKARFEREAKALASLAHPAIVGIVDRGRTDDGSFYLVLDYIEGEAFEDYLDRLRKEHIATVQEIVRLFIPIAEALGEAHRREIVHRDIKPSNLRIDIHSFPHVLDFGLARLKSWDERFIHSRVTVTGNVIGSLPWSSPEQASGDTKIQAQSDVYSLGVVMYKALAGEHPYPLGNTMQAMTRSICKTIPRSLDRIKKPPFGRVNPILSDIILKCLQKKPEDRYSDAHELAADLKRFLNGRPTVAGKDREPHPLLKKIALVTASCAAIFLLCSREKVQETAANEISAFVHESGIEFIRIASGEFAMGSHPNDGDREDDEDYHRVVIGRPFALSRTEITRKQYVGVMGQLPVEISDSDENLPVTFVSWNGANEFCSRLSTIHGQTFRLPTEAEWEYACRSGTRGRFAGSGKLADMGWFTDNSGESLHPVAGKAPNGWGLFDMHGNAAEWCFDGYYPHLGFRRETDPVNSPRATSRVVRGGQFGDVGSDCRAARRRAVRPSTSSRHIGFRVVMELAERPTTSPSVADPE